MKILFLNYEYPPLGGGAGVATEALVKEWSRISEMEVHVVTSAVGSSYEQSLVGNGVFIHRLPIGKNPTELHSQSLRDIFFYTWTTFFFLRKLVAQENKQKKFEATLCFFTLPSGFLGYLIQKMYGLPFIIALRGADVPGFSEKYDTFYQFFRPLTRFLWTRSSAVVANSAGLRDLALQTSPDQTIGIIENGVDIDLFRPSLEKKTEPIVFLTISRLTKRKGIALLIAAFGRACAVSNVPLRLDIIGSGEEEGALRRQVSDQGLNDRVRFAGAILHDELPKAYQEAHVFVMASKNEGMSNAVLEALSSGLPLIVSRTGGMAELVTDGVNGFFAETDHEQDFADRMLSLAGNPSLRERFGAASRERALERSWRASAQRFQKLLENRGFTL